MIAVALLLVFSPFLCASAPKQVTHDPSMQITPTQGPSKCEEFKELMEQCIPMISTKLAYSLICKDFNKLVLIKSDVKKNPLFMQYPDFVIPLAAKYVSQKVMAIHNENDPSRRLNTDHKQVLSLLEKMGFINERQELYQDVIDGLIAGTSDSDIIEIMENTDTSSDED